MSRIGKEPITLTDKVTVSLEGDQVKLKGAKYEKIIVLKGGIKAELKDKVLTLKRPDDQPQSKAYHGAFPLSYSKLCDRYFRKLAKIFRA